MNRDRDRILEQALKHELRAADTPPAAACLDAETLGAWTDGGLAPAAMAAVEAHVSTCARCQSIAGAMARSTLGTIGTIGTEGTFSLWKWWLAPIAAGVTAVTLWMVVPDQPKLATAPPQPATTLTQGEAASTAQAPAATQAPAPVKDAAIEQSADRLAQRDNKVVPAAREDRQQAKRSEERKEEVSARQERAKLADAAAPAAAAALPPPAPPAPRATAEFGALQKTAPKVTAPAGIEVTDQSAPSDSVCWFVGRAGLVMLTTDAGATFTRVNLSEPLDIANVTATDARIAIVTTVSGRRFRTEDGGLTWRPF